MERRRHNLIECFEHRAYAFVLQEVNEINKKTYKYTQGITKPNMKRIEKRNGQIFGVLLKIAFHFRLQQDIGTRYHQLVIEKEWKRGKFNKRST